MRTLKHSSVTPPEFTHLISEGSAVRDMSTEERNELWRSIAGRVPMPRPSRRMLALLGSAVVATALLFALSRGRVPQSLPPVVAGPAPGQATKGSGHPVPAVARADSQSQARTVHLGMRGDLFLWPDAQLTLPPGADADQRGAYRVRLDAGRIAASVGPRGADEPLAVVTPELAVIVVGTRFSVDAHKGWTEVAVEQGKVRVERGRAVVLLSAGQSIRSDDPLLWAESNAPMAMPCAELSLPARRACLASAAEGQGISAENALVALALLERDEGGDAAAALARFRDYQRRFPTGVLFPEVALSITGRLAAAGDLVGARAEAESFRRRFPRDKATYDRLHRICWP
jgi:hypothetical protein